MLPKSIPRVGPSMSGMSNLRGWPRICAANTVAEPMVSSRQAQSRLDAQSATND
jgi:hypothetical protein